LYEESTTAAPKVLQTVLGWARLEEVDRNFDEANKLLDRAEEMAPHNPSVMLARAVVLGRKRQYEEALATLDAIASQMQDGSLGPNELLEKGRLLDQMGRYDEAWAAFEEGKRKAREVSGHAYLAQHAGQLIERLKRFFTSGRLKLIPRARTLEGQPQPLFIIGFPRSGTTLVEQSLTVHPAIAAGDELPFIAEITNIMPRMFDSPLGYPEALAELWMGDRREGLDNLRDYYLQKVRQLGILEPEANWFTDKMPLNEMNLGLIGLLFPQSPIIHVLRHPLDVITSVFSNHLTHGFFCSYELTTAAQHYAAIFDLIEHYKKEMTLRYMAIRYEDIVEAQEDSVRRMLDFIGEPFDPRCLNFVENRRYARTASYAQVTEKLYDRSRYRHRHYLKQLEPVIPILQPAIERLGYPI
jgi:tetratricopeptide (TPR) repeat protein